MNEKNRLAKLAGDGRRSASRDVARSLDATDEPQTAPTLSGTVIELLARMTDMRHELACIRSHLFGAPEAKAGEVVKGPLSVEEASHIALDQAAELHAELAYVHTRIGGKQ